MAKVIKKSLVHAPDSLRTYPHGSLAFAKINNVSFALATQAKGWHWKKHVKPIAGTEWCEFPHTFFAISGVMHIKMKDGQEIDIQPGDVAHIPAGHDAWVVGDEPAVAINVTKQMADYARTD